MLGPRDMGIGSLPVSAGYGFWVGVSGQAQDDERSKDFGAHSRR